ncbi:c-type cytochrome [Marinobacter sp.]|uniref:c-type cytochrome n=1 Tax=Marinobacter sp. TaxID=50741 RepID=UPI00384E836C
MVHFTENGKQPGVALTGLLLGLLGMPGQCLGNDSDTSSLNEAALANLVVQDCGSCHGLTLRGGLGPPLLPEDLADLPVGAIAAIIREGVPGTAMPPWKPLLSPGEIHWISEQLKSGELVSP